MFHIFVGTVYIDALTLYHCYKPFLRDLTQFKDLALSILM